MLTTQGEQQMSVRRSLLRAACLFGLLALAPLRLLAAQWNRPAFEAKALAEALKSIGAANARESDQIEFKAPEIAENGAIVPIEVTSRLPGPQIIYVFAEKNPNPLAASFEFLDNVEPFFATRIKMRESAKLLIVVRTSNEFFSAGRDVKVTIGGCGVT
jgi:sulfur-oxidizing protein SoxY